MGTRVRYRSVSGDSTPDGSAAYPVSTTTWPSTFLMPAPSRASAPPSLMHPEWLLLSVSSGRFTAKSFVRSPSNAGKSLKSFGNGPSVVTLTYRYELSRPIPSFRISTKLTG